MPGIDVLTPTNSMEPSHLAVPNNWSTCQILHLVWNPQGSLLFPITCHLFLFMDTWTQFRSYHTFGNMTLSCLYQSCKKCISQIQLCSNNFDDTSVGFH